MWILWIFIGVFIGAWLSSIARLAHKQSELAELSDPDEPAHECPTCNGHGILTFRKQQCRHCLGVGIDEFYGFRNTCMRCNGKGWRWSLPKAKYSKSTNIDRYTRPSERRRMEYYARQSKKVECDA